MLARLFDRAFAPILLYFQLAGTFMGTIIVSKQGPRGTQLKKLQNRDPAITKLYYQARRFIVRA